MAEESPSNPLFPEGMKIFSLTCLDSIAFVAMFINNLVPLSPNEFHIELQIVKVSFFLLAKGVKTENPMKNFRKRDENQQQTQSAI